MAITFVNVGTPAAFSGNDSIAGGLPASLADDDLMILAAVNVGTAGTMSAPAGWDSRFEDNTGNHFRIWTRKRVSGDTAPQVTTSGKAGTDTCIHQIVAFRGADWDGAGTVANGTSQNIGPITGLSITTGEVVIVFGGKSDDWTSVATLSGDGLTWNEIGEPDSTTGSDAGLVWDYAIAGSNVTVTSKTFTVTGGTSDLWKGVMASLTEAAAPVVFPRKAKHHLIVPSPHMLEVPSGYVVR